MNPLAPRQLPEDNLLYGEPEWMPSAEEVAQARNDLERRGVVRALSRGQAGLEMVPAGETPWPWLIAAGLWLILWPAALALKIARGQLTWLPWWLLLLLAGLHLLALVGPVLLAQRDANKDALRRRFGKVRTLAQMLALEPGEFEIWIGMLFQLAGYYVRNTQLVADHGIDLAVSSADVRYGLVQCKRHRGSVGEPVVRDLYGTMTHEGADRGWLATTGGISRQARAWSAGKPIELWDGQVLVELARKYR